MLSVLLKVVVCVRTLYSGYLIVRCYMLKHYTVVIYNNKII